MNLCQFDFHKLILEELELSDVHLLKTFCEERIAIESVKTMRRR